MTTSEADLILRAIADVRSDLTEVKAEIAEVKAEARKTNGRIGRLELWRAGLDAVAAVHVRTRAALLGVVSGVVVAGTTIGLERAFG